MCSKAQLASSDRRSLMQSLDIGHWSFVIYGLRWASSSEGWHSEERWRPIYENVLVKGVVGDFSSCDRLALDARAVAAPQQVSELSRRDRSTIYSGSFAGGERRHDSIFKGTPPLSLASVGRAADRCRLGVVPGRSRPTTTRANTPFVRFAEFHRVMGLAQAPFCRAAARVVFSGKPPPPSNTAGRFGASPPSRTRSVGPQPRSPFSLHAAP